MFNIVIHIIVFTTGLFIIIPVGIGPVHLFEMVCVVKLHHVLLEVTRVHVTQHNIVHLLVLHVHLHVDLVQVGDPGVDHRVVQRVGRAVVAGGGWVLNR